MRDFLCQRFHELGQSHMIADVPALSDNQVNLCLSQIKQWEGKMVPLIHPQPHSIEPIDLLPLASSSESSDRFAILILAGGQGSRLGFSGPKGCFTISGHSLFEWHLSKILDPTQPIAIMTSPINHEATLQFFQKNQFFGFSQSIRFFKQQCLPLIDDEEKWFWEKPGIIAEGPDGNGAVFECMEKAKIFDYFSQKGARFIHVLPVDNPLAHSFPMQLEADILVRCIQVSDETEPMGRLVKVGHKLKIVEFAELSSEMKKQCRYANTGLLSVRLDFAQKLATQSFPTHWARRSAAGWKDGRQISKKVWKAERFIVDALDFATNPQALCCQREQCYAPLKDINSIPQIERLLHRT